MKTILKVVLLSIFVVCILSCLCACDGHKHSGFTDEIISISATCTTDGKGSHICGVCGEVVEFTIPATGHTEVIDEGVEPTCTQSGISEGKHCSVCNEVLTAQTVLPAAHTESDWIVTKKPTCTDAGSKQKECTACKEIVSTETIPANGHTEDWVVLKEPTCTDTGSKQKQCTVCEETLSTESILALGHDKTDWVIVTPAACLSSGFKQIQCTRCGATFEEEVISALGHKYIDTVVPPTCTADGYTEHKCVRCDFSTKDNLVTKTGHSFLTKTTEPTCVDGGFTEYTCLTCGFNENRDFTEALGHNFIEKTDAATCLTAGKKYKECSRCKQYELLETLPATGHTLQENVTTTDRGNYTNRDVTTLDCANCDYSYVRKIVFKYNRSLDDRIGANQGRTYGVNLDYSDVTSKKTNTFGISYGYAFTKTGDLMCHLYVTHYGKEGLNNFISGSDDKVKSINESIDYSETNDKSGAMHYDQATANTGRLADNKMYFLFCNTNQFNAMTVKTLEATFTFDFGEPQ